MTAVTLPTLATDKFYINGAWVDPLRGGVIAVENPATETSIAEVPAGTAADIDAAVAAAKAAFPTFSRTSKAERLELLAAIREVYVRKRTEMARLITAELGAPLSLSKGAQTAVGVGHLDGFVKALEALEFESINAQGDLLVKEPIGVVGLITPWNWPINQIALKILAAIATGCTSVLKPSELTPLNAILYMDILHEAGVPAGVVNMVHGTGPEVGVALSAHPDVAMVSFTGSTRAGREITRDAAETIKRVTLELGGKSPNILLPDADLEPSVSRGVRHVMMNTGQSCNAPTRMLVQKDSYAQAVDIATATAAKVEVGDPQDAGRHIGPLVSGAQWQWRCPRPGRNCLSEQASAWGRC
ncbi:MAG: aldehyde dehydrogenase family protein, partial [Pseudomonadota bacterium]